MHQFANNVIVNDWMDFLPQMSTINWLDFDTNYAIMESAILFISTQT